jgi:hypothetical protein
MISYAVAVGAAAARAEIPAAIADAFRSEAAAPGSGGDLADELPDEGLPDGAPTGEAS